MMPCIYITSREEQISEEEMELKDSGVPGERDLLLHSKFTLPRVPDLKTEKGSANVKLAPPGRGVRPTGSGPSAASTGGTAERSRRPAHSQDKIVEP